MELRRLTGAIPIAILIAGFAMAAEGRKTNLITKARGMAGLLAARRAADVPYAVVSQSAGDRYFGGKVLCRRYDLYDPGGKEGMALREWRQSKNCR